MIYLFPLLFCLMIVDALPSHPNTSFDFPKYSVGFQDAALINSIGGYAVCMQGKIPLKASAANTVLNFSGPANQMAATQTILDFLQVNTSLPSTVLGSKHNISGTYSIASKICFPKNRNHSTPSASNATIHFLTHGVGFDKSYWDFFSSQYSYIDAAARRGIVTFSYDRLGTGDSEHPDPIQVVQAPLQIAIAHQLIRLLRNGAIASTSFQEVIGVGHSLGAQLTNAITSRYTQDLDGAVLLGFSLNPVGIQVFFSALNFQIASHHAPLRFSGLANGYLVSESRTGNQFSSFSYPNFDPLLLDAAENSKQTFTIGELFTNPEFVAAAPGFVGKVFVANGEFDLPFCGGRCLLEYGEQVRGVLYPDSKAGGAYTAKGAGHVLNLHFGAEKTFESIFDFLGQNVPV